VLLLQADSLAIIVPEHVATTYKDLIDNPELLNEKNIKLSLYAEIYNFDEKDKELIELIKSLYLSAGNSLRAFDMEVVPDKKDQEDEDQEDMTGSMNSDTPISDSLDSMDKGSFNSIDEPMEDFSEVEENLSAYKKFKKHGSFLESLESKLYNTSNIIFKENTKTTYLNEEKNILIIQVDNSNIYNKFKRIPLVAKKSLSAFGESIRNNKDTQLIDSFIKDGKRYFVVAESIGSNFWVIENEALVSPKKESRLIQPIQNEIIRLKRSSIRKEVRKSIPYISENKVVFDGGVN
jgi:hypothetical protein